MEEEISIHQPQGMEMVGLDKGELVCRLHKSFYGLPQSPRNWNARVDKFFRDNDLMPTAADP